VNFEFRNLRVTFFKRTVHFGNERSKNVSPCRPWLSLSSSFQLTCPDISFLSPRKTSKLSRISFERIVFAKEIRTVNDV
jgi:hypothetical protein